MSKHTPTPDVFNALDTVGSHLQDDDNVGWDALDIITRACNAHEGLVKALEQIAMGIPSYPADARNLARAALAEARE